jgi:general stress protein YciG
MKERSNDSFLNLADALAEDIINASDEELLAEVAEDFGDPYTLSAKFDRILASIPVLEQGAHSQFMRELIPTQRLRAMRATSNRGFASMDAEKLAPKGGQSVPNEKRSFSQNRSLAAEAGRKGGAKSQKENLPEHASEAIELGEGGSKSRALKHTDAKGRRLRLLWPE